MQLTRLADWRSVGVIKSCTPSVVGQKLYWLRLQWGPDELKLRLRLCMLVGVRECTSLRLTWLPQNNLPTNTSMTTDTLENTR